MRLTSLELPLIALPLDAAMPLPELTLPHEEAPHLELPSEMSPDTPPPQSRQSSSQQSDFAALLDATTTRDKKPRNDNVQATPPAAQPDLVSIALPLRLMLSPALTALPTSDKPSLTRAPIALPAGMTPLKTPEAPPETTSTTAPAWVARVLSDASVQQHAGGGTAQLQIEVPDIGTCECRVTVRGDTVQVHLAVPPSPQQPLQPQLSALSAGLRSLGLQVSEVVVSISETSATDEDAPERDTEPQENES
jgi:hypothetical protein